MDHSIFDLIPGRHTIVTTLRHPIPRMLSYYNFASRNPVMAYHADLAAGRMSVIDYAQYILETSGPQYCFFDDSGEGTYLRSGTATAAECLENLLTKVSLFGLTDQFGEFATLLGYLLGFSNVLAVTPGKVSSELKSPQGLSLKTEVTKDEMGRLSTMLQDDLWFYDRAVEAYERRISAASLQAVLTNTEALRATVSNAMKSVRELLESKSEPT